MTRSRTALLAALLAALTLLGLAGARLGSAPLGPEEARHLPPRPATRAGFSIEATARLPSLGFAVAAVALLAVTLGRATNTTTGWVVAALAPLPVAAARTATPQALGLLVGALAVSVQLTAAASNWRRALVVAVALLALLVSLPQPLQPAAAAERTLSALLGAWGLVFGSGLPPWRLDIALPALAAVLPTLWLGAGSDTRGRALGVSGLLAGAALLGAFAPRPGLAPLAAAPLVPWLMLALARGALRLPKAIPGLAPVTVAVTVAALSAANLHSRKDVLDPALRVKWDQAARMLSVLTGEGDGVGVVAAPDLPAPLALYASPRLEPPLPGAVRVLVIRHGLGGGADPPGAAGERALLGEGYTLKGELEFGSIEPGWSRLYRRLTGTAAASAYLRIRRYEIDPGLRPKP